MGIITRMLVKLVPQEKIDSLIKEVIESKFSDVLMQDQSQLSIRVAAEAGINELELEEAVSSKWSLRDIAASVADVLAQARGLLIDEIAEKFSASDIASEIDIGDVAGAIDLDDLADKITEKRMKDIDMSQIDYDQLAISLLSTIKLLSTLKEKVSK